MKKINWATRMLSTFFAVVAVVTIVLYFRSTAQTGFRERGLSSDLGIVAISIGGAALAIWVARKIYVEMKRRQLPNFELTRQTIQFLRANHIWFGWVALITATAHGLYYLVVYSNRRYEIITGWSAWSALFVLSALGIWFDKRLTERKKAKSVRLYHIGFAFLFAVGALLHLL